MKKVIVNKMHLSNARIRAESCRVRNIVHKNDQIEKKISKIIPNDKKSEKMSIYENY